MEHLITPPPELLEQWLNLPLSVEEQLEVAARWGRPAPVPVPVSEWQPIDTAPKDGTEILATDGDAIEIVSWVKPRFDVGVTGDWFNREGERMFPAWWQPLTDHSPLPLPSGEVES